MMITTNQKNLLNKNGAIRKILLMLLSIIFVFLLVGLIEFTARIYNHVCPPLPGIFDFRRTQPLPYQNAPYFSQEFITESIQQSGLWLYPQGVHYIVPMDFNGQFFHSKNGCRRTAYQPQAAPNTVYVFGGSTVFCAEVPDEFTITSYLQTLFNRHYPERFCVNNYGMTSATTSQELERLKTIPLKAGDIVVFYDGVNDIFQDIFFAAPQETMIERNRRAMVEQRFSRRLAEYSVLVKRWIDYRQNYHLPAYLASEEKLVHLVDALKEKYQINILQASEFTVKHNALFFHFLQPNIFTVIVPSSYERQVLSNPNLFLFAGTEISFRKGYPELEDVCTRLFEDHKIASYSLIHIFDQRKNNDEFYLDTCHVNHHGNRIIAEHMFEKIRESISVD